MPRYEGNTPNRSRGHHRGMHSASKGRGGDAKLKEKKRLVAENNGQRRPPKKTSHRREEVIL